MIKIAFPTDDGETISAHLGRAAYYKVFTLEGESVLNTEQRVKPVHGSHGRHDHDERHERQENRELFEPGENQGDRIELERPVIGHVTMFDPIGDCQVLIARGMGEPAYNSAVQRGLEVILTSESTIENALKVYRSGEMVSDMRRVHKHS